VVVGQTAVLVVEGKVLLASMVLSDFGRLLSYGPRVGLVGSVPILVLEVGKPEVVVR